MPTSIACKRNVDCILTSWRRCVHSVCTACVCAGGAYVVSVDWLLKLDMNIRYWIFAFYSPFTFSFSLSFSFFRRVAQQLHCRLIYFLFKTVFGVCVYIFQMESWCPRQCGMQSVSIHTYADMYMQIGQLLSVGQKQTYQTNIMASPSDKWEIARLVVIETMKY